MNLRNFLRRAAVSVSMRENESSSLRVHEPSSPLAKGSARTRKDGACAFENQGLIEGV
jgi:hypothetical protein